MKPGTCTRLLIIPAFALAILLQGGCASRAPSPKAAASAQSLFAGKLTLESALQQAAAENKKVFAVFDGSGPGENTGMGIAILGHAQVVQIIKARTIPVLLDATETPETTGSYRIKNLPTFLLLEAGGKELARWINEADPDALAEEIADAVEGRNSIGQLRAKLKPNDLRGRLALARKLNTMGSYQDALDEYIWICDFGHPPDAKKGFFSTIRNEICFSLAVDDMAGMQKAFPPAREALMERCKQSVALMLATPESRANARRYLTINRALADDDGLLESFYALAGGNARKQLKPGVFGVLAKGKHYTDAVAVWASLDEALKNMNNINEIPRVARGIIHVLAPSRGSAIIRHYQFQALQKRAMYFAVYAGAGRTDDARIIAKKIIKWDRFSNAPDVLRKTAQATLGAKSDTFLQALDIPAIHNNPDTKS
ncbi:MAG: thioredoxin family protein [Opitutaceae bacterium]|jgi:outer membrane murein-binding lipoprotein Lpp|nr:thioredoxin family protein [Opitutaceae bacterium]